MIYTMLLCCTSSLWRGPNKKSLHPAPIHRRILAKQPSISKRIVKGSSQHVQCLNLVAPPKEVVDLSLCGVFRGVGTRVNIRTSSLKLKGSFLKKKTGWWFQPLLKKMSVGIIIPNIWKNNKCSKPPTRKKTDSTN